MPQPGTPHSHEGLKPSPCRIFEIVQYSCDMERVQDKQRISCFPIPRIFRICPGRPAIEITKYVHIMDSGEVVIPVETSELLPKGKPWRDVERYPANNV